MHNTLISTLLLIIIVIVIIFFYVKDCKVVCNSFEGYTGKFDPNIDLYVVNKAVGYGGKQYNTVVKVQPGFKEKQILYDKSVYINKLMDISDIETSGDYARGWISNASIIDKIKQEAVDLQYTKANVYAHIVSNGGVGYYINGWHWVESQNVKDGPSKLVEYISLDDIRYGKVLGAYHGNRATEICLGYYKRAEAAGLPNLCKELEASLSPNSDLWSPDFLKRAPPSVKTREDVIKNIIDELYAKLKVYRQGTYGV